VSGTFFNVRLLLRRQFLGHLRSGNPGILRDIRARPLGLVAHRSSVLLVPTTSATRNPRRLLRRLAAG
jgi:hypothetical protein